MLKKARLLTARPRRAKTLHLTFHVSARTPPANFFSILLGERHLGNPIIVLRFRQPGLRRRQAEQFALAGAVFDP